MVRCGGFLYHCPQCGITGCEREGCTNQRFNGLRCMVCNTNGEYLTGLNRLCMGKTPSDSELSNRFIGKAEVARNNAPGPEMFVDLAFALIRLVIRHPMLSLLVGAAIYIVTCVYHPVIPPTTVRTLYSVPGSVSTPVAAAASRPVSAAAFTPLPAFTPAPAEVRADSLYRVLETTPVFAEPDAKALSVAEVHEGKYVHVIAIADPFVKVWLRSGVVGYVPDDKVAYQADWIYRP
jgi:hypothetical protein